MPERPTRRPNDLRFGAVVARNRNVNSNDPDVVKITRKTNLAKLYRARETLRAFVKAEMTRRKYTEEVKTALREAYK